MSADQPALDVEVPQTEAPTRTDVAQVLVLTGLPHLDRPFDYAIPESMRESVRPGVRVKVRFAGTDRDGFVISRNPPQEAVRELAPLRRVISDLPVLTPHILGLCRAVARRYAGTTTDVIRLAIPPRHAAAEKAALERVDDPLRGCTYSSEEAEAAWAEYPGGVAFLRRLAGGQDPRAVWCALPQGSDPCAWAGLIGHAVAATVASGHSAIAVLPDVRDVEVLAAALTALGVDHDVLTADQGPSARYRRFVRALTGQVRVVIGTRSAAFAPVLDLGLVVCWDDGDDLLAEQRAPYPHARVVLAERAHAERAGALIGGYLRTPVAQQLVESGWARSLHAEREVVRRHAPRIQAPGELDLAAEGAAGRARIPHQAWRLLREGLEHGPVLVQVPRSGYVPGVSCAQCRHPARCARCHGRLHVRRAQSAPACSWCGRLATAWSCEHCQGTAVRASRVGSTRTAEELGRAFPGVPVVVSGRDGGVVPHVPDRPQVVVATPGAEPVAESGYAAAALLDAAVLTERPELDAGVEAVRRWMRAAALVRRAPGGGRVILLGHGAPVPAQALVRWDPIGLAERELLERTELGFPPRVHMVALTGPGPAVRTLLSVARFPHGTETLGPVDLPADRPTAEPGEQTVRALVRSARSHALTVNDALIHAQAHRSARKEPGSVRVQVDPVRLW